MSFFDVVLIFIIGSFGVFGLWFGFITTLGSLLGTILGVFLASRYYAPFAEWLMSFTGWTGNFSKVAMFIAAFLIINRLVGFLFYLIARVFHLFTHLPFIHGLNVILGLLFGLAEGIVVVGVSIYFMDKYPFWPLLTAQIKTSAVVPYCIQVGGVLWPLIPEGISSIQNNLIAK